MINKKISVSEDVADLSIPAQLLFTWSVPHADDVGLLPKSPRTLKGLITPMWDMSLGDFLGLIDEIEKAELWVIFEHEGKEYYQVPRFTHHQTLKRDRQPMTILDFDFSQDHKESWVRLLEIMDMETTGNHAETNGNQIAPEDKRREDKRREKGSARPKQLTEQQQADFDAFWSEYPNKKSKKKAQEWWLKHQPSSELVESIMAGLAAAKTSDQWVKDDGKFIPHPSTWLNGERWTDDVTSGSKPKSNKYGSRT